MFFASLPVTLPILAFRHPVCRYHMGDEDGQHNVTKPSEDATASFAILLEVFFSQQSAKF